MKEKSGPSRLGRQRSWTLAPESEARVLAMMKSERKEEKGTFCCWQTLGEPPCCREYNIDCTYTSNNSQESIVELTDYTDDEWRYFVATSTYTSATAASKPPASLRELLEPDKPIPDTIVY